MQMKSTCDLILRRSEGPPERDTRRFTCQNGEGERARPDWIARAWATIRSLFTVWFRGGANQFPGRILRPPKSSAFNGGLLRQLRRWGALENTKEPLSSFARAA
jgi:hypothetical protein